MMRQNQFSRRFSRLIATLLSLLPALLSFAAEVPPPSTASIPISPSNGRIIMVADSYIQIGWNDQSNNETRFAVYVSTDGSSYTRDGTSGANTTSYFHLTPTAATRYYYRVYAENAEGASSGYASTDGWTDPATPAAPTIVSFAQTTVFIRPNNSSSPVNSPTATYAVRETNSNLYIQNSGFLQPTAQWNTLAYWDTTLIGGLDPATSYRFVTIAKNGAGVMSSASSAASFTTYDLTNYPYQQDFSQSFFPPALWSLRNYDWLRCWERFNSGFGNTGSARMPNTGYTVGQYDILGTPAFSTVGLDSVLVTFDWYYQGGTAYNDTLDVIYSNNDGQSFGIAWERRGQGTGSADLRTGTSGTMQSPGTEWGHAELWLPPAAMGMNKMRLGFLNRCYGGPDLFIDNVGIYTPSTLLTASSPTTGQELRIGVPVMLNWTSAPVVQGVRAEINYNYPTGEWQTLYDNLPNNGFVDWTVTGSATTNARIRYSDRANPGRYYLTGNLSIVQPTITMLYPAGGESLIAGESITLTWNATYQFEGFNIELNRNYPTGTWEAIGATPGMPFNYTWTVTSPYSTHCRFRIKNVMYESLAAETAADFSIIGPTPVTYSLDAHSVMRLGLLSGSMRPLVHVTDGGNPGIVLLSDDDHDSIWTVTRNETLLSTIHYRFAIDRNGDANNTGDWVYESMPALPRSATISETNLTLAAAIFDHYEPTDADGDAAASVSNFMFTGSSGWVNYVNEHETLVRVNYETMTNPLIQTVRRYSHGGTGTAPNGIEVLSTNALWRIWQLPMMQSFNATTEFSYSGITGITAPGDLRILYRPFGSSAWSVQATNVDLEQQKLTVSNCLSGEWTIGSTTTANPLTPQSPGAFTFVRPNLNEISVNESPVLIWAAAQNVRSYRLYVWPEGSAQPFVPTVSNITGTTQQVWGLAFGQRYYWQVVADNLYGMSLSPVGAFTVRRIPNLVASQVTVPPSIFSEQIMHLTWRVTNNGSGSTILPEWSDILYVSPDSVYVPGVSTQIGAVSNETALAPGEYYTGSYDYRIPVGFHGSYYFFVVSNYTSTEVSTTDNVTRCANPVDIVLTPPCDLVAATVTSPHSVFTGNSVTVYFMVRNDGVGSTAGEQWIDALFLSRDSIYDASDFHLGSRPHTNTVTPGNWYDEEVIVRIPDGWEGTAYFILYTDFDNRIFEHLNVMNNIQHSDSITIHLTPPPDLSVTSITHAATANSGTSFAVDWNVANIGAGSTDADHWIDRVYASPSDVFSFETAIPLGIYRRNLQVAATESYHGLCSIQIPNGISGTYYLYVIADADTLVYEHGLRDNNLMRSPTPVTVALSPWPDLIVDNITVPLPIMRGSTVPVTIRIRNNGTAVTQTPNWLDRVYFSRVPYIVGNSDTTGQVDAIQHNQILYPAGDYTITRSVLVPEWNQDSIYIIVQTDAGNAVYEHTSEGNNAGVSAALPTIYFPPTDIALITNPISNARISGDTVTVNARVRNIGVTQTNRTNWYDQVYLSTDTIPSSDDSLLVNITNWGFLDPDEEYTIRRVLHIPNGMSGQYYLLVVMDATRAISDTIRSNNQSTFPMNITLASYPDLSFTSLTSPSTGRSGQPVMLRWSISNTGTGGADSRFHDAFYLSQNSTLDNTDYLLGYRYHQTAVPAGTSFQDSASFDLPIFLAGDFYVIGSTDAGRSIYEFMHETNNTLLDTISISMSAPSDLVIRSITAPAAAEPGSPVSIAWTIDNVGENAATGFMRTGVYCSRDTIWDIDDALMGVDYRDINIASGSSADVAVHIKVNEAIGLDDAGNFNGTLPGLAIGNYYVIVRADIRNNIRESNELNNSTASLGQINVTVPSITSGVLEAFSMNGPQSKFYKVTVPAGTDLSVVYDGTGVNELYVAYNRMPSTNSYDAAGTSAFSPDQQALIPSTLAGDYYILVLSRNLNGVHQNATLLATAMNFSVLGSTPEVGAVGQFVTCTVTGAGFRDSTRLFLQYAPDSLKEAEILAVESTTRMRVRWHLTNVPLGVHDLIARNPDNSTTTLVDGYEVVPIYEYRLTEIDNIPPRMFMGQRNRFLIRIVNESDCDVDYFTVMLGLPSSVEATVTSSRLIKPKDLARGMGMTILGPDTFSSGSMSFTPLRATKVAVGEQLDLILEIGGRTRGSVPIFLTADCHNESFHMLASIFRALDVRDWVAREPQIFQTELVTLSPDTLQFVKTMLSQYEPHGLADHRFTECAAALSDTVLREFAAIWAYGRTNGVGTDTVGNNGNPGGNNNNNNPAQPTRTNSSASLTWQYCTGPGVWVTEGVLVSLSCAGAIAYAGVSLMAGPVGWTAVLLAGGGFAYSCMYSVMSFAGAAGNSGGHSPGSAIGNAGAAGGGAWNLFKGKDFNVILTGAKAWNHAICSLVGASSDPNDIIGPNGVGEDHWVGTTQPLAYTIRFENDPNTATANANLVTITQPLDSTLDWTSFRLSDFGWGNLDFHVPANRSYWTERIDLRDSLGIFVDVSAGVNVFTGEAFWTFETIDPLTGQQPNSTTRGFLAINDSTGNGCGYVSYVVKARGTANMGENIVARARIVFDRNDAIDTPEWINLVDTYTPQTHIRPMAAVVDTVNIQLWWSMSENGTGYDYSDLYVSDNNAPFVPVLVRVTDTTATYTGEYGHTYRFFTRAHDFAGNVEAMKTVGDVTVQIQHISRPRAVNDLVISSEVSNGNIVSTLSWTPVTTNMENAPIVVAGYIIVEAVEWGGARYETDIDTVTGTSVQLIYPHEAGINRYFTIVTLVADPTDGVNIIRSNRNRRWGYISPVRVVIPKQ